MSSEYAPDQSETSDAQLKTRIHKMALTMSPDYPDIEQCKPFEQLYAIEGAYQGTEAANKDLHLLIGMLRDKLGWTNEQVLVLLLKRKGSHD